MGTRLLFDAAKVGNNLPDVTLLKRGLPTAATLGGIFKAVECVVVGEGYPAWWSTAESLCTSESRTLFCGDALASSWFGAEAVTDWEKQLDREGGLWAAIQRADVVLISGSEAFIRRIVSAGVNLSRALCALDGDLSRRTRFRTLKSITSDLRWNQASHKEAGGATDARCWIGVGIELDLTEFIFDNMPSRYVLDCLNPTERDGTKHLSLSVQEKELLQESHESAAATFRDMVHPRSLLPAVAEPSASGRTKNEPSWWVCAPSVFAKSGWTRRMLTSSEIGQLWDLPMALKKHLQDLPRIGCTFTATVPAKILWRFASAVRQLRVDPKLKAPAPMAPKISYGVDALPAVDAMDRFAKATKSDDAEVPVYIWDTYALRITGIQASQSATRAFDLMRQRMLSRWRVNVRLDFLRYIKSKYGADWAENVGSNQQLAKELAVGRDCLTRCSDASWWEWSGGSTLFYWRWPPDFVKFARDGVPVFVSGKLPTSMEKQRGTDDVQARSKVAKKLKKIRGRRYVVPGFVRSLTSYFHVPKGEDDIRMVYDASRSGLNDQVWSPKFGLPTVESVLDILDHTSSMADIDLGEMFLNFPLDPKIRPYVGIDLSPFLSDLKKSGLCSYHLWDRCLMGFKPSPYNAVRSAIRAEDVVRGDPNDPSNVFRWSSVRLNLPGQVDYDPSLPWVSKVRADDQGNLVVAADFKVYIDDVRPAGPSEMECWKACGEISKKLQYLGIQDAARKRRPPSQAPGAWAGSVVRISDNGIGVSVTRERWEKTKRIIHHWSDSLAKSEILDRKQLESDRGFLVYVARTFPAMKPFLKGIHLTLDSWRLGRGEDGWAVDLDPEDDWEPEAAPPSAPSTVHAVPRLADDLASLRMLCHTELPPVRLMRPKLQAQVRYGFGDASGAGFGSTIETPDGLRVRFGTWGSDMNTSSSNFRELRNLVEALEDMEAVSAAVGCEVFLFTDNAVAEAAFHNGTSSNRTLFNLVLRLRMLELKFWLQVACGTCRWHSHDQAGC